MACWPAFRASMSFFICSSAADVCAGLLEEAQSTRPSTTAEPRRNLIVSSPVGPLPLLYGQVPLVHADRRQIRSAEIEGEGSSPVGICRDQGYEGNARQSGGPVARVHGGRARESRRPRCGGGLAVACPSITMFCSTPRVVVPVRVT